MSSEKRSPAGVEPKTTYLDGGWGWVVVLASFLSQSLIGSVYFGYGVLLPEWMAEFESSSALTSFVGCTASGVISTSGPIASFFISKWSCRVTHMVGGAMMSVAFILCYFATTMTQIFVLYSVFAGIGGGLCYVPAIVSVTQYFKYRRAIVIGIAAAGCGCGSFIFPMAFEYFMQQYDWRGVMLIAGAFNANLIACGLVMCPVDRAPKLSSPFTTCHSGNRKEPEPVLQNKSQDSRSDVSELEMDANANYCRSGKSSGIVEINVMPENEARSATHNKRRRSSFQLMSAWLRNPMWRRKSSLMRASRHDVEEEQFHNGNDDVFMDDKLVEIHEEAETVTDGKQHEANGQFKENEGVDVSMLLPSEPQPKQKPATFLRQTKFLARSRDFYVMLFNNVTMFIGMMIVFGLTPLRSANDFNMTANQGAILLSVIGLSNLLGRFLWGFVAAIKRVDSTTLFLTLRLCAAVLTICSQIASSFEMQFAYCVGVGTMFGCWSIYAVVVSDQFGDGLMSVAYGYLEASNGVGAVIGPMLGGYLFDKCGVYQYSFIFAGAILIVGMIPLTLTHATRKCAPKNEVNI